MGVLETILETRDTRGDTRVKITGHSLGENPAGLV